MSRNVPESALTTDELSKLSSFRREIADALDAALVVGGGVIGTADIADGAVTLAKMADIATSRILGRVTASTGDPEALTGTQATTLLDAFTTSLKGLVPPPGGSPVGTNSLLDNGTWGPAGGYVTPEQYGAVGDGTTDDYTAISNAVAAAIAMNGLAALKFGAGKTYYISEAIRIESTRGLQVWGNKSEILFPSDDTGLADSGAYTGQNRRSGFHIRQTQDVVIRDLKFRGTGTDSVGVSTGSGAAIYARQSVGLRIERCQHELGGSLFLQDAVTDTTGTGDSLALSGSTVTLTDAGGAFHAGMVGMSLFLAGCSDKRNDGQYRVASVTSATVLTYVNAVGVNETSSFTYTIADGDRNTVISDCVSRDARMYCSAAGNNTVYRNCRWEWSLAHADVSGKGDALSISGTTVTLTDYAGRFRPHHHGKPITIANATTGANNVTAILTYISSTQVSFTNAAGVTESYAGAWYIMAGERVGQGAGVGALSFSGSSVTVTASAAVFKATDVGRAIHIGNATTGDNEGTFVITAVGSSTQATFTNAGGASEDFSGFFTIDTWDRVVDGSTTHGSTHGVYVFAGRTDVKILGCSFSGNRTTAVKVSGSSLPIGYVIVDGCTFTECGEVFTFGADDAQDHSVAIFTNNIVVDCAAGRPQWATGALVNILGSRAVRIVGNNIYYTRDHSSEFDDTGNLAGAVGIKVERYQPTVSQPIEDVLIADNRFTVDRKSAFPQKQLATAILLEDVGVRSKWATSGTLTKSGSTMTLAATGNFLAAVDVGKTITLVNAPDAGNNGSFVITEVPNSSSVRFVNAGGTGGGVSAGTWRILDRSNIGSIVIERNYISDCASTGIATSRCVGPTVRHNTFQNLSLNYWSIGDCTPLVHGNRMLSTNTLGATFRLGSASSGVDVPAWPIFFDNTCVSPYAGYSVGNSSHRDIGIGIGNSTRVNFPLLGKQGRVRPTGGYEEVVIAYGSNHVDGDTVVVNLLGAGSTFTYKASTPGANQFSTFAELVALITAIANIDAADYGTGLDGGSVATQHIRIRRTAQSTSDGNLYVYSTALNPTALVCLPNDNTANTLSYSRGSCASSTLADKTVVWSPMCSWNGTEQLVADNAAGRTLLGAGSYATATITCVANASMADGDYITIGDGVVAAKLYEYDKAADGVTAGRVNWAVAGGAGAAADVAATLKTAIEANQPLITVVDAGSGVLTLTHKLPGTPFNSTITENVANAGFTVSGFTGGDTGGYQAVKNTYDAGSCVVLKHAPIGSTSPEFRFLLGGD